MLIRFNVRNFLSFSARKDDRPQEFSMLAGKVRNKKEHLYDDTKLKLLKFAAVYGANASGKSNLVKAIDFMKRTITDGLPKGHTDKYCKVELQNKEKESYFELEISFNNKYYAYGFEVVLNSSKFVSEWLIELTADNNEKVIFTRDITNNVFTFENYFKDKKLLQKLNNYADDIKSDESALLLSIMNQNKKSLYEEYDEAIVLKNIYMWIKNSLDVNYPDDPISNYSYMADNDNIEEICRIISAFGTGITNFKMVEVPVEKVISNLPKGIAEKIISNLEEKLSELKKTQLSKIKNDPLSKMKKKSNDKKKGRMIMRSNRDFFILEFDSEDNVISKTIQFAHGKNDVLFDLGEESDGTIRVLDLIEILINKEENKVYIIDELDRCLHPSLSFKFVETFLQLAEKRNVQLIVTTHESRLMDFELLRRDELWFVNKDKSGVSDIYSLEEYNARFDQKIDKAYLEGRYGGVPVFSTVFPIREE